MSTQTYRTASEEETITLGRTLAAAFHSGDIVALFGDLGSGKTTLVKGISSALGAKEEVTSPTFTLMHEYPLEENPSRATRLIHVDTYRLKNLAELRGIGIEDYLGTPDTICLIEWPEIAADLLKQKRVIQIHAAHTPDGARTFTVTL